jgi:glucuronoarabinoxylan endo-1,4-beta-xylanase
MTEVYHPNSSSDADTWPEALDVAVHIHRAMAEAEFQTYVWWYIRRSYGPMKEDGTISKRGYMMAHFSKFVRHGYERIDATKAPQTDVFISAYINGGGDSVTVVAVNKKTSVINQSFAVSGGAAALTKMEGWRTTGSESMAKIADIGVADGNFTASLPAQSVTTFVGALPKHATGALPKPQAAPRARPPAVTVRGRALSVNAPAGTVARVRVVNATGKTVARFSAPGGSTRSLGAIPAGAYFIEAQLAKDGAKTVSVAVLR